MVFFGKSALFVIALDHFALFTVKSEIFPAKLQVDGNSSLLDGLCFFRHLFLRIKLELSEPTEHSDPSTEDELSSRAFMMEFLDSLFQMQKLLFIEVSISDLP